MADWVECYCGQEYAERPLALHWQGERLLAREVLHRWRTPQGKVFHVRTADQQVFSLFYDELDQIWQIEPLNIANPETH